MQTVNDAVFASLQVPEEPGPPVPIPPSARGTMTPKPPKEITSG